LISKPYIRRLIIELGADEAKVPKFIPCLFELRLRGATGFGESLLETAVIEEDGLLWSVSLC
jgi:hypothetical protein